MLSNRLKGKFLLCFFCLLLVYSVILPNSTISAEEVPSDVVEAAVNGLSQFLRAIPANDLIAYGFSGDEIAQAKLGEPIRVHTIIPDKIIDYHEGMDFASIISATNLWLFPVLVQAEMEILLTVDLMNGKWKAVAIGSAGLAKQLDKIKIDWPSSDGYAHKLVRIFQANCDFMILSTGSSIQIKPLSSAILSLGLQDRVIGEPGPLYDPCEVMAELTPIVRQNIEFNYMSE